VTEEAWKKLRNFYLDELDLKGRPITAKMEMIEPVLMFTVDNWVSFLKDHYRTKDNPVYCRVHCITLGKHKKGSYHTRDGKGRAFDGHVVGVSLHDMFTTALMFGFGGVGVYFYTPEHSDPDMIVHNPYIHVDVRPWNKGRAVVWYRENGKYEYDPRKVMERITRTDATIPFPYLR